MSEVSPIKGTKGESGISDEALKIQGRYFRRARGFGARRPLLATGAALAVGLFGPIVVTAGAFAARYPEDPNERLEKGLAWAFGTLQGLVYGIGDRLTKKTTGTK